MAARWFVPAQQAVLVKLSSLQAATNRSHAYVTVIDARFDQP